MFYCRWLCMVWFTTPKCFIVHGCAWYGLPLQIVLLNRPVGAHHFILDYKCRPVNAWDKNNLTVIKKVFVSKKNEKIQKAVFIKTCHKRRGKDGKTVNDTDTDNVYYCFVLAYVYNVFYTDYTDFRDTVHQSLQPSHKCRNYLKCVFPVKNWKMWSLFH
jgi:hypothetical protein